ncbi:g2231 [Coccomyxa viridis]|uniref:G2231 protein n=1 Tax=Coccomyxa viridis TaxID=1274662 RepID=A0ABP1FMU1_9CHLO
MGQNRDEQAPEYIMGGFLQGMKGKMFGNCFTPKPARSGATAQLSVVNSKSQKFTESYPSQDAQPKTSGTTSKASGRSTGAQDIVSKLNGSSEKRAHLASLLKEHCLVEGGDSNVKQWLKDEGLDASVATALKSLENTQGKDLLFWANRYHLFVSWSPDRSHPWDSMAAASQYVTLEIGVKRGTTDKAVVLMDGKAIDDYTMSNGVLKTNTPIEWETPNSQIARVNLQLQFSAFFGYGQADAQPGYLGLQCHGLLWPVMDSDLPHYWPIAPPVVSGKVNTAGRDAAISPGSSDSLADFAGTYATHLLPAEQKEQVTQGCEITIKVNAQGEAEVAVGGRDLSNWTFDASNVLAWADDAGYSAWLQFTVLPGGPVFMGTLHPHGEEASGADKYRVFGELMSQPSRLAPNAAVDSTIGQLVASGLSTSATVLCTNLLRSASKCWSLLKTGMSPEDILMEEEAMLQGMRSDFQALDRVHGAYKAASLAFPAEGASIKEMSPEAAPAALEAESEAADHAQAARVSADAVAAAVTLTNDCIKDGNAVEATSKAAASAWRSSQAAAAASSAEESAIMAAKHAGEANTANARAAAISAAQSYNLARESALAAARAEAAAASNALKTVETGINYYAARKEYIKLKDIAEASDVAGKALGFAKEAVEGFEESTAGSREAGLDATRQAADYSQLAHKLMRAVYSNKAK